MTSGSLGSVVVCTNLSGRKPFRPMGMVKMMTSGRIGCQMASILAQNVASNPDLGTIFAVFIAMIWIHEPMHCMAGDPILCRCVKVHCMYIV